MTKCASCAQEHPPETYFPGFHSEWGKRKEITDKFLNELEDRCGPNPVFGTPKCVWAVSYSEGLSLIEEIRRLRKANNEN